MVVFFVVIGAFEATMPQHWFSVTNHSFRIICNTHRWNLVGQVGGGLGGGEDV